MALKISFLYKPDLVAAKAMTSPGGEVYRWFDRRIKGPIGTRMRREVPKRTGSMALKGYTRMYGVPTGFAIRAGNFSGYATYVHEGTHGPIFPSGKFLLLGKQSPTGKGYPRFMLAKKVSGQKANPWITRSASKVLVRNGWSPML